MLSALLILLVSCLVSFVGSLQLGPVNLFVINSVLFNTKKAAFWVAVGGSLPEFIYCALAIYTSSFLQTSSLFLFVFKIIFILILVCIAIVFFIKKTKEIHFSNSNHNNETLTKNFIKGFSLAALNPQLLPFWIFVEVYFNSTKLLKIQSNLHCFSFILGAGLGAFILLISLILIVTKYKAGIAKYINHIYYNKMLAILFLLIAAQQLISLIN